MGIFLRKSFSAGPVRFNISKSGLGVSAGVKGLRVGVGPRGAVVSGGRKGVYFRKSLSSGSHRSVSSMATMTAPRKADAIQATKSARPMNAGGQGLCIFLGVLGLLPLAVAVLSSSGQSGPLLSALVLFALAVLAYWKKVIKIRSFKAHEENLLKLTPTYDRELLQRLQSTVGLIDKREWGGRHRYIYTQLFDRALEDGIDDSEMTWLRDLSELFGINTSPIHEAKLKERLWEYMGDGDITEEEEAAIGELLTVCGVPKTALDREMSAMRQFIQARPLRQGQLPTAETSLNLQRGEVCHHHTKGSLLEKKVLRTYTIDGERHKEEGLTVSKTGEIYITSKRVLIVGDGTSTIPHAKILDTEIDPDNEVISITKDGRQKPLFLRVPDLIYTGILLEAVSKDAAED